MQSLKPTHLSFGVGDLERSQLFYRDVLGLPTRRAGSNVFIEWPDFLLVLSDALSQAKSANFHFGFRVDSTAEVDAWAARLHGAGVSIVSGPTDRNPGRVVFISDPDGYEIEIYSE